MKYVLCILFSVFVITGLGTLFLFVPIMLFRFPLFSHVFNPDLVYGMAYICLPLSFVFLVSGAVTWSILAKASYKYPLNERSDYCVSNFEKFLAREGNTDFIYFTKKNGIWVCENETEAIRLDLTGYPFEEKYLVSYVVRNLRFLIMNRRKPCHDLLKNKYYVENAEVNLVLTDGERQRCIRVVKNYVSKYGFLAWLITRSPYCNLSGEHRARCMKEIGTWNEDIYQDDFYISFRRKNDKKGKK